MTTKVEVTNPTDYADVVGAVNSVRDSVDALPAKLTRAAVAQFDLQAAAQSTHVRMRTSKLVISPTIAGLVIIGIGQRVYNFTFVASLPMVLPFVQLIDRGVDVFCTPPAGGFCTAYMIYTAE